MRRKRTDGSNLAVKLLLPASRPARHGAIEAVLKAIPSGCVSSYGQVADLAGLPRHARLVARVLRITTLQVPWFRVLRSDGRIAFPKDSDAAKRQADLLRADGVEVRGDRVDLRRFAWHNAVHDLGADSFWLDSPIKPLQ